MKERMTTKAVAGMEELLVVVVLYKQDLFRCDTYRSLLAANPCDVFIYDNSPVSLTAVEQIPANWHYLHDPSNAGLSVAYNRGAKYAVDHGKKWIMLADQDTAFTEDILPRYLEYIADLPDAAFFAPVVMADGKIISPVAIGTLNKQPVRIPEPGFYALSKYFPINSGSLIRLDAFLEAGGYDENVALDFSDYAFSQRMLSVANSFYLTDSICHQNFSDAVENREQKMQRFRLFCRSVRQCRAAGFRQYAYLKYVMLRRVASLCIRQKTLEPLKIYFSGNS